MLKKSIVIVIISSILVGIVLINLPYAEEMQLNGLPYSPKQFSKISNHNILQSNNWLDYYSIFFVAVIGIISLIIKNRTRLMWMTILGLLINVFAITNLYFFSMTFCVCRLTTFGYVIIISAILEFLFVLFTFLPLKVNSKIHHYFLP